MSTKHFDVISSSSLSQQKIAPGIVSTPLAAVLVATLAMLAVSGCRSRSGATTVCPPGYVPAYQPGNAWPGTYPPVTPPNAINPPLVPPNTTNPPLIPPNTTNPPFIPPNNVYPPATSTGNTLPPVLPQGVYPPAMSNGNPYPPVSPQPTTSASPQPTYPGVFPPTYPTGSQAWARPASASANNRYVVAESTAYPPVVPRPGSGTTTPTESESRPPVLPPSNNNPGPPANNSGTSVVSPNFGAAGSVVPPVVPSSATRSPNSNFPG